MKKKSETDSVAYALSPHIELVGNRECIVEGLKGITEYTKGRIRLDLGKFCVTFNGCDLYINSFTLGGAVIEGTLLSLEFESHA